MVNRDTIREAFKQCYDPEIPINIVDLGLVYGIEYDDNQVDITMTLTSVGCPVADQIQRNIERQVLELDNVEEVNVEIVYDPPWTPDMVTEDGEDELESMGVI
ncbi:MAG: metal-sulfur cluster assembly factor [bacterium]